MCDRPTSSRRWRERGNQHYQKAWQEDKDTMYETAIRCYTKALNEAEDADEKASAAKNMAKALWNLAKLKTNNPLQNFDSEFIELYLKAISYFTISLDGQSGSLSSDIRVSQLTNDMQSCVDEAMEHIEDIDDYNTKLRHLNKISSTITVKDLKTKCYIKQSQIMYEEGLDALEGENITYALDCFKECNMPIELAKQNGGSTDTVLEELQEDLKAKTRNAQGKQIIHTGVTFLTKAIEQHHGEQFDEELVYGALDAFREAIAVTNEKDFEVEAAALSHIGRLYDVVFDQKDKAKEYFSQCIQLAEALETHVQSFVLLDWYTTCTQTLAKYQVSIVATEEKTRREIVKKLLDKEMTLLEKGRSQHMNNTPVFLKYICEKFPVKNRKFVLPLQTELDQMTTQELKRVVRKVVMDYHSDKQKEKDKKGKILCEEITKELNNIMEKLKL